MISKFDFNYETDKQINLDDLQNELISMSSYIYHYGSKKADADYEYDLKKVALEEARS